MLGLLEFDDEREAASKESLLELMRRAGEEAQARGLTSELLEESLRDE